MKLIRSLVLPWIVFFLATVAGLVLLDVKITKVHMTFQQLEFALGIGAFICFLMNINTLGTVGIWMSESLPESLRFGSWNWILRAIKAAIIALAFWFVGQLPWIPLVWQAAVLPAALTILLFVAIWSLLGPILKFSSNMAWNRAFSVILSLPILATVPLMALFVAQMMVTAYRASQPELVSSFDASPLMTSISQAGKNTASPEPVAPSGKSSKKGSSSSSTAGGVANTKAAPAPKIDKRAEGMRQIAETGGSCAEHDKEIHAALDPHGSEETTLWAIKAVSCSTLRSVVALPRLVQIMLEHPSPTVRAASIRAMKKYGNENLRQISYLLVKRLSDREPHEVVEAAAVVLAPLGAEQQKYATKRLTGLLDVPESSFVAAESLKANYGREDLVAEYVAQNLTGNDEAQRRAVGMICLLNKDRRAVAEPHLDRVIAAIKDAGPEDPGVKAINCLGAPGFKAIREEVAHPRHLDRVLAAHALSELKMKDNPEALETAEQCVRDGNDQVRKWCSRALGQMGAPALPKILALLKSSDGALKLAGQNSLEYFDDASAKDELRRIRADNSGWMANNRKLQIARAVGTALAKIQNDETPLMGPVAPSAEQKPQSETH